MEFEANGKGLVYERVDPDNAQQIEDASLQEREGFGTELDPQELPPVLRYIARNGDIWLQYAIEDNQKSPTGVIKFIPLENALKFDFNRINSQGFDLSVSPFVVIMKNQESILQGVRNFAQDKDIIYHHGIAMSRKQQGYGTLLLRYALERTPKGIIVCYIDGAQVDEDSGGLQLAPNEDSYTVHLKAGFVLTGVVDPPLYDEELTYYSFVKMEMPALDEKSSIVLNLAEAENAKERVEQVRSLTSNGYLGVEYNKNTHQMVFKKARP